MVSIVQFIQMASRKNAVYVDLVEDDYEDYYSELAGDTSVYTKCARNKRSASTCYSSKHVRVAVAASHTK